MVYANGKATDVCHPPVAALQGSPAASFVPAIGECVFLRLCVEVVKLGSEGHGRLTPAGEADHLHNLAERLVFARCWIARPVAEGTTVG